MWTILIPLLIVTFYLPPTTFSTWNTGKQLTWQSAAAAAAKPLQLDSSSQDPSGILLQSATTFTYLARAQFHTTGILCGQYLPNTKEFVSSFQGYPVRIKNPDKIQILKFQPDTVSWTQSTAFSFNLVLCGREPGSGEHLFACRAESGGGGELIVGYFRVTKRVCVINDNGEEVEKNEYEYLVMNYYGILSNGAWPA